MSSLQESAGKIEAEATLAGAGLLAAASSGALMLARAAGSAGWRIVWMNDKAGRLLGSTDVQALTRAFLSGTEPGPRQLSRLAAKMSPEQDAADLRLRLRLPDGFRMLALSVRKIGNDYFALAPWGARVDNFVPAPSPVETDGAPSEHRMAMPSPAQTETPQEVPPGLAPAAAIPQQRVVDRRGNVRFLWRTNRNGEMTSITGALCEVMGCDNAEILGKDFRAIAAALKLDMDGRLRSALSRQETWSGLEVMWPAEGGAKRTPVVLGALPGFDRARAFDGFSGFGVIHIDRAVDGASYEAEYDAAMKQPVEAPGYSAPEDAQAVPDDLSTQPQAPQINETLDADVREAVARSDADRAQGEASENGPEVSSATVAVAEQVDVPGMQSEVSTEKHADRAAAEAEDGDIEEDLDAPGAQSGPAVVRQQEIEPNAGADAPVDGRLANATDASASEQPPEQAEQRKSVPVDREPARPAAGANVVPIFAWQRETRVPFAATETPNFARPEAPREEPRTAPPAERSGGAGVRPAGSGASQRNEELVSLSPAERNAFREIARALSTRNQEKAAEKPPAAEVAEPAAKSDDAPSVQPHEGSAAFDALLKAPAEAEAPEGHSVQASVAQTSPSAQPRDNTGDALRVIERLDAGILVSRSGVPAYVNKTLLDMLGYAGIDEFYRAGGVDRMFRGRDPDALSREAEGGAIPVVTGSGDVLALEGRVQSIEWDGEPATLMTFRRSQGPELNARIRALELDLRQRDAEARETHAILDTATDGVVLVDEEGRILNLNKSGQALFGYDQNEVAGESFTMLFARESQPKAMDYLSGLKSNGVKSLLNDGREVLGRARQGGAIPLFMTLGRVGTSTPQKFCAVLRDLTQWKNVERDLSDAKKEAERASALKSDFLAKVSHEIRTPLNAILGFAEVIMDERFGAVGNERYKEYLKDIHSSGTHVLSLVNDLLDLSKIEAGKLELNFGAVNVNKIVNECVSLIQQQATRERIVIRLSLAPRLPNVVADERSLRQIALNILSNAVKYNEPGGQVIVSTALTDAGQAVIRVRDTGIGMNEKELETALEPFRQVATSRQTTGTGLGLPLTKALVEANRAAFTIKSRKGEGTLVEVSFPQTRVLAE